VASPSLYGLAGLLALIGLASGGARADVTPEEVWQNWQDIRAGLGQQVSAESVERQGDTLIVSGIRLAIPAQGGGLTSGLIGEVRFQDRGDGTVAILLPESFPVIVSVTPEPGLGQREEVTVTITAPRAAVTASGMPDAVSYASLVPSIQIRAEIPDGSSLARLELDLARVTARTLLRGTEGQPDMTGELDVEGLNLTLDVSGEAENAGKLRFSIGDLAIRTATAGKTSDMTVGHGAGTFDLAAREAGQPFRLTGALGGGTVIASAGEDHFAFDGSERSLSLNFSGGDGDTGDDMSISAILADVSGRLQAEGSDAMSADFDAALAGGLKMSGGLGLGPASFDFAGQDAGGASRARVSLGGLDTTFALEARALAYGIAANAVELALTAPEIPVPEAVATLGGLELDLAMPLERSGAPEPFHLLARLVDLGLGEEIWAMLDGAGMLPHDPATLILDTEGTVTLLEDLAEAGEALDGALPLLINKVTLNEMVLQALGARVTGEGALAFDNEDMPGFPNMPHAEGSLQLAGQGVIGLMDKLMTMGVMTGEEALGLRMMMGAFARVDPVKDEIATTLDFRDGQLHANGNKVQ